MNLRVRLNLLITGLFVAILLGGSLYIIRNARQAVSEEMESTAHLTLQLVETLLASARLTEQSDLQRRLLEHLAKLEQTRHLQIIVMNQTIPDNAVPPQAVMRISSRAPAWFERWVTPPPMEFRRIFSSASVPYTVIIIRADPSDEITEAWEETRSVLMVLLLFIIMANVFVYFLLGRDLAPIESILQGLQRIEQGDYHFRLPRFNLPEVNRIAEKINHLAEVLLQSKTENRFLTQQALRIQEQERQYLARELHDELGQSLSAIKAVAVSIDKNPHGSSTPVHDGARAIISISEHMYTVARNMMQRLRPSVLDELGLFKALQEMIDKWNDNHQDAFCRFECRVDIDGLGEEIRIHLFRIIQECLTNIAKHAGATEALVAITETDREVDMPQLQVVIRDNGRGFTATATPRGMGISGMRERVEAMNGKFIIDSAAGQGTTITITLSLTVDKT